MEAYPVDSSIESLATGRTPIELWRMILLIAVESPVLPRNGDDILDGMILFYRGCRSQLRHQNIEALRCRLRLVCRVWNAILDDEGAHFSFLYRDRLHRIPFHCDANRKIRRIELAPYCDILPQDCVPRCVFPRNLRKLLQPTFEDFQWIEHLQQSDGLGNYFPTELIMDILDKASRLRALELRVLHKRLSDILNHPTLTQITHLSIGPLGTGYGKEQLGPPSFPAVRYLSIEVSHNPRQEHVLDWKFPSLDSFHLRRGTLVRVYHGTLASWERIASREDHPFYGLQRFLTSHSKQITSLNIEYGYLGDGL